MSCDEPLYTPFDNEKDDLTSFAQPFPYTKIHHYQYKTHVESQNRELHSYNPYKA